MSKKFQIFKKNNLQQKNVIDKLLRNRIYKSQYWKEELFGAKIENLIEKASELKLAGGTYGKLQKPTKFLCLIQKMLQINPSNEVVLELIFNKDFKFVSLLGIFYIRLVATEDIIYKLLEEFYTDYRRIRIINKDGSITYTYMDQICDDLLQNTYYFSIQLPRINKRLFLEQQNILQQRISPLQENNKF